ncbi:MAG: hypothetical protein Q4D96_02450 [Propionibacteriaceae bacterium]|nr:hypothetical protein [Propionibacteriaceae bacterium]
MTELGTGTGPKPRRLPVLLLGTGVLVIALVAGGIWWFGRGPAAPSGGGTLLHGLERQPQVSWSIPQGRDETWAATTAGVLLVPVDPSSSQEVRLHAWEDGAQRWAVNLESEFEGFQKVRVQENFRQGHCALLLEAEGKQSRLVVLSTADGAVERSLTVQPGRYHEVESGAVYRLFESEEEGAVARYTSLEKFDLEWETRMALHFGGAEVSLQERQSRLEICLPLDWNRYAHGCQESLELTTGRPAAWLSSGNSFERFGDTVVVAEQGTGKIRGFVGNQEKWSKDLSWATLWAVQDALLVMSGEGMFRLDPRTGEEKWRSDLGESQPVVVSAGEVTILMEYLPSFRTALLDLDKGRFEFQEHDFQASGFHELTDKGWIISIQASEQAEGVVLRALEPGRAAPVWEASFPEYFWASNAHGHLLLQGGDTLAVAR